MKIPLISRIVLAIGSLATVATFFLPLWQIQLWAPQYPEGLNMKIWHNKLSGAFDIINGLNHYIGMREIKEEMFPEFSYLGILIGIFIALGLLTAYLGKYRWLVAFTILTYVYGALAIYDFYQWGYDYGHNLDTHAAIQVPGMTYQPPVIGYKNLLNFTAYSGPDAGGWIIIAVGFVSTLLLFLAWYQRRKLSRSLKAKGQVKAAAVGMLVLLFSSCSTDPVPIKFGSDACDHCKMTMTDERFGAEIVTSKGKTYKFDDVNCMISFLKSGTVPENEIASLLVVDFLQRGQLIHAEHSSFLRNEEIRSPMRSDVACFSSSEKRDSLQQALQGGQKLTWAELEKKY